MAKRAKATKQEDAVLLTLDQFQATVPSQPPRLTATGNEAGNHHSAKQAVADPTSPTSVNSNSDALQQQHQHEEQQHANHRLRDAAIQLIQAQAVELLVLGFATPVQVQVLQISGFMHYVILSVQAGTSSSLGAWEQRLATATQTAFELALGCSRQYLNVVAVDVQVVGDQPVCYVIVYAEGLNT